MQARVFPSRSNPDMIAVSFPYNRDFIQKFKDCLQSRKWIDGVWIVAPFELQAVLDLLRSQGLDVWVDPVLEGKQTEPKNGNGKMDFYSQMFLDRSSDNDQVKKRFKALALALHPDRGGDNRAMQILNSATSLSRRLVV